MEESGTLENFRLAGSGGPSDQYHLPLFRDSDLYKGPRGRCLGTCAWPGPRSGEVFSLEYGAHRGSPGAGRVPQHLRARRSAWPPPPRRCHGPRALLGRPPLPGCGGRRTAATGPVLLGPIVDRYASMLVDVLRSEQAGFVEGHAEIETALVELYRTTRDPRLVDLAADLLARRGHKGLSWRSFGPSYFQDDVAFEEVGSIRGHAVRALYLLAGPAARQRGCYLGQSTVARLTARISSPANSSRGSRHVLEAAPSDVLMCERSHQSRAEASLARR
jgi:hypothetical protein